MVSKGYHYMINLSIVGNFYISIDPAYAGPCAKEPVATGELRRFWVLPSP